MSINDSDANPSPDPGKMAPSAWDNFRGTYNTYVNPALLWAGICGHVAVIACLLSTRLVYRCSASVYVCAMSMTATIFLLNVFATGQVSAASHPQLCHLFLLLPSASSFCTNLFMVALVADRCAYWSTHMRSGVCQWSNACMAVVGMSVVALVVHVNLSLTVGLSDNQEGEKICTSVNSPMYNPKAVVTADIIIDHVIPNLVLTCLVILLAYRIITFKPPPGHQPPALRMRKLSLLLIINHVLLNMPKQIFKVTHILRALLDIAYAQNGFTWTLFTFKWLTTEMHFLSLVLPVIFVFTFHGPLRNELYTRVQACIRKNDQQNTEGVNDGEERIEMKETLM